MSERFTHFKIEQVKSNGTVKQRDVFEPSDETRQVHSEMLGLLNGIDIPMPHAHGSTSSSLIDNVLPHQQGNHFYMLDLNDAYKNVDINHLKSILEPPLIPIRFATQVQEFIDEWATDDRTTGLPFGAPASPRLFDLYCIPLDRQLARICKDEKVAYTRYLDDLTFSSRRTVSNRVRRSIRETIEEYPGASINHAKTRSHKLGNGAVTITGVSIYPDRRLGPSPAVLEKAIAAFDQFEKLLESGQLIFDNDLGTIDGYHSALKAMSTSETPTIRQLLTRYKRIRALGIAARA